MHAANDLQTMAKHVMNIHMNRSTLNEDANVGEIDVEKMKKYIAFCKM